MKSLWLSLGITGLLLGCSYGDRDAGKGIITETTNGVSARGRIVTADSVPIVSGSIIAVLDEEAPEAWEGKTRATGTIRSDGTYTLTGLDKPNLTFYAKALNANGGARGGIMSVHIDGTDDYDAPDLVAGPLGHIEGTYTAFDSVTATLPQNWRLYITIRGPGRWTFLESAKWSFDSLPPGVYHYRIQKSDWIPGHEVVLFQDSMSTIAD